MTDFLILAHLDDQTALRTAAALRRRYGTMAVRVVSAEALAMAPRVIYTQASNPARRDLDSSFDIELVDGARLQTGGIRAVFNRLRQAEALHFAAASEADRQYAGAELSALWVSWLAGLATAGTPVVNRAGQRGLQPGFNQFEWLHLAARAGFPIHELQVDSSERSAPAVKPGSATWRWLAAGTGLHRLEATAAGETGGSSADRPIRTERRAAYIPLPDADFPDRVRRLQALSGCALFELSLVACADPAEPYRLAEVDPFPQTANPLEIELIVQMLEARR